MSGYLLQGNEKQKEAYYILQELHIFELLKPFSPILVGTIPIDIDLPESDLDIICEVHHFDRFKELVCNHFQSMDHFSCVIKTANQIQRIVINFEYRGWPIEIFGQPIPTHEQNGYRHMVVEERILKIIGEQGKERIRALKKAGLKTEPAFGTYLRLEGNPYEQLLEMYTWEEEKLREFVRL